MGDSGHWVGGHIFRSLPSPLHNAESHSLNNSARTTHTLFKLGVGPMHMMWDQKQRAVRATLAQMPHTKRTLSTTLASSNRKSRANTATKPRSHHQPALHKQPAIDHGTLWVSICCAQDFQAARSRAASMAASRARVQRGAGQAHAVVTIMCDAMASRETAAVVWAGGHGSACTLYPCSGHQRHRRCHAGSCDKQPTAAALAARANTCACAAREQVRARGAGGGESVSMRAAAVAPLTPDARVGAQPSFAVCCCAAASAHTQSTRCGLYGCMSMAAHTEAFHRACGHGSAALRTDPALPSTH